MKTKQVKIIGEIPKPSQKTNVSAIMESAKEIFFTDGVQQKKALLAIQEANNQWIDSKPTVFFNGFIKIEKKIYQCTGWKKNEKTELIILDYVKF